MFFDITIEQWIAITLVCTMIFMITNCCGIFENKVVKHEGITTKIVSNSKSCVEAINELLSFSPLCLGLDCEWVSSNKISLLQIGHPKLIILIRLHKLKYIPSELIGLMNDNQILKCGVGIYNDINKLRNDYNIDVSGCIDINDLISLIPNFDQLLINHYGYLPSQKQLKGSMFGLNRLTQILLNKPMKYKNKQITISNWEVNTLTMKQIQYAADDALIGYKLFKICMQSIKNDKNTAADTRADNINSDISDCINPINHEEYLNICWGRIDIHHYYKSTNKSSKKIKFNNSFSTNPKLERKRKRKTTFGHGKSKDFFDNYKILKPDGSILFYCSKRSADWYLKKKLAKSVNKQTIELLFEPNISNTDNLKHYQSKRVNQCFICGKENVELLQFDIVPKQYRSLMDLKFKQKAWRFHDYIPLCVMCHPLALQSQRLLIDKLCKQYNITHYRISKGNVDYTNLCNTNRAAKALQNKYNQIPIKRKIELLQKICDYFNIKYEIIYQDNDNNENTSYDGLIKIQNNKGLSTTVVINECIQKLKQKMSQTSNKNQWQLHAKLMIESFKDSQPLFIELWRKHFVDYCKPRFLPKTWTVSAT